MQARRHPPSFSRAASCAAALFASAVTIDAARRGIRASATGALLVALLVVVAPAFAVPVVDTTFGVNGIARVAAPSGVEDTAQSALRQPDGMMVVGGRSEGRASHAFAVRFTNAGSLDPMFGQAGVVLLDPARVSGGITQIARRSDGRLLLAGSDSNGYYIVRLTTGGAVDASFASNGVFRASMRSGRSSCSPMAGSCSSRWARRHGCC